MNDFVLQLERAMGWGSDKGGIKGRNEVRVVEEGSLDRYDGSEDRRKA